MRNLPRDALSTACSWPSWSVIEVDVTLRLCVDSVMIMIFDGQRSLITSALARLSDYSTQIRDILFRVYGRKHTKQVRQLDILGNEGRTEQACEGDSGDITDSDDARVDAGL